MALSPDELTDSVNDEISNGWIPLGGVAVGKDDMGLFTLIQAVVKPKEGEEKKASWLAF